MDHVTTKHEVEPRASEKTWTTSPRENPHTTTRSGGIFNSTRRAARIQQARPLHPLQPRVACAGFQKMHTSHPSTFYPATKWRLVSCQSDPGASSCSLEFKQFTTRREAMDHFSKLKAERLNSVVLFRFDDHERAWIPTNICSLDPIETGMILQEVNSHKHSRRASKGQAIRNKDTIESQILAGDIPLVPQNISYVEQQLIKKATQHFVGREVVKFHASLPYKSSKTIYNFDPKEHPAVKGRVALTIDDGPCRLGFKQNSLLPRVLNTLEQHHASATFMMVGQYMDGHERDLARALSQGHELANHGMLDQPYHQSSSQQFAKAVDACNEKIWRIQSMSGQLPSTPFFRAPHAKYSQAMERVLEERNMINVMCDTFAFDTLIEDEEFIGNRLAHSAQDGSVILLHMPERGFREWCLPALARLLEVLVHERNMQVVSVGELYALTKGRR